MFTMDTRHGKAFTVLLFASLWVSGVWGSPCPVCSKWEGQGFHDAQVTSGGRCKIGTIPKGCIPTLNKSTDYCVRCKVTVPYNSPSNYRRCPKCFGRGEVPDKIVNSTEVAKPSEPKSGDSTASGAVQEDKQSKLPTTPDVVMVSVKKCDKCDDNGKLIPTISCDLCENGFNHKKDGDAFKCRICGKACASRFAPCCRPDCPECGDKRNVKTDCPYCGGDKVITPLEEAKNKERAAAADAKQ